MPSPLRALASEQWQVRTLDKNQLMVSAGQFVAYFDLLDDAFVTTEEERRLPRTAALAVVGFRASERLGLVWKVGKGVAVGRLRGKSVTEVSRVADEYSIHMCVDHVPATLHLAALHGIAVLREAAERPRTRKRGA